MFSATAIEAFGPFCGRGGFGSVTGTGWGKSPRQAISQAILRMREDENRKCDENGIVGGGVPIFDEIKLLKDGKVILYTDIYKCQVR